MISRQDEGRKIAIAVDFSPYSKYTVQWAIKNHLILSDDIILLLVLPKTPPRTFSADLNVSEESRFIENLGLQQGRQLLRKFTDLLATNGFVARGVGLSGDVEESIAKQDSSRCSEYTLQWAIEHYLLPSDEIALLLVLPKTPQRTFTADLNVSQDSRHFENWGLQTSRNLMRKYIDILCEKGFAPKGFGLTGVVEESIAAQ
ncbi:hypothetical protein HK100_004487, partial [Physocladia obscura]